MRFKALLIAALLVPTPALAFDYLNFAIDDTIRCAHPTTKLTSKRNDQAQYFSGPTREGNMEKAQVEINYKGLTGKNTMVVDYQLVQATDTLQLIHGNVVKETSLAGHRECDYFANWSELDQSGVTKSQAAKNAKAQAGSPADMVGQANALSVGESVTVATVSGFDYQESNLKADFDEILNSTIQTLSPLDKEKFTLNLVGHADTRGSKAYNQSLSEARATAVQKRLEQEESLAGWNMDVSGAGESQPIKGDQAASRRVEISVEKR